jgi:hypothetical protein
LKPGTQLRWRHALPVMHNRRHPRRRFAAVRRRSEHQATEGMSAMWAPIHDLRAPDCCGCDQA